MKKAKDHVIGIKIIVHNEANAPKIAYLLKAFGNLVESGNMPKLDKLRDFLLALENE